MFTFNVNQDICVKSSKSLMETNTCLVIIKIKGLNTYTEIKMLPYHFMAKTWKIITLFPAG